jgi:hypothetical protein
LGLFINFKTLKAIKDTDFCLKEVKITSLNLS